ncbi:MAG: helix-turn-helix domain-containing protein [Myxococcota bacterium]
MARFTRVFFALFPDFELLDLSGPASVFSTATRLGGRYETIPITPTGGSVPSAYGFAVESRASRTFTFRRRDLLLVVGGERRPLAAAGQPAYLEWLRQVAKKCGRFGSVCSGAYLLAGAGLVNGRTISTHWDACSYLHDQFPDVTVDPESIYTKDGAVWTSAGVTTGIDMALAIVEEDHGAGLSADVAKRLVVFARRQGNQRQFSSFLEAQTRAASREVQAAVDWMVSRPSEDTSVSDLAKVAGMAERTFYRSFKSAMGVSPAKFLERLRLDLAKDLLEAGVVTKEVADRVGFRSYSGFRAAFLRTFGLSPSAHQRLHARTGSSGQFAP